MVDYVLSRVFYYAKLVERQTNNVILKGLAEK